MSYQLLESGGKTSYNKNTYVCDTVADIENLPTNQISMGSFAFVIETSQVFALNSKGEWKEI